VKFLTKVMGSVKTELAYSTFIKITPNTPCAR